MVSASSHSDSGLHIPERKVFSHHQYLESRWVDSTLQTMTLDEKIAQLLMIRTYSNKDRAFYDSISRIIMDYKPGGLCFFQGDPVRQAELTNHWQQMAKTPMLIAIDAEWGLGMRLKNCYSFPRQMTMGAMQNDWWVYRAGEQIGQHCRKTGIHINFAPVIDINSNPKNPVINFRSFGEDARNVASKGNAYIRGLQNAGIIATAKHFPGHGDTDSDSHYTLPLLRHNKTQIETTDLFPFRKAIEENVGGIMVAHLFIPALDERPNMATSLSEKTVDSLLKNSLGFDGLAITDALDMQGVTNYHQPGDIELKAFLAGNDILLLPLDVPKAIKKIRETIESGLVSEEELNSRVRKILAFKQLAGLDIRQPVKTDGLIAAINQPENELISRKIFEQAITLVKNNENLLPLKNIDTLRMASICVTDAKNLPFTNTLDLYAPVEHFFIPSNVSSNQISKLKRQLKDFNLIILAVESMNQSPAKNFGITKEVIALMEMLKKQPARLVINLFGNPYSLVNFDNHNGIDAIMVSYENEDLAQEISAQMILGAIGTAGKLPVSASQVFPSGTGIDIQPIGRLKYSIPEEVGIPRQRLDTVVKLIEFGISKKAYPGAQVLLAKDGIVFFNRSFGMHTYEGNRQVNNSDIYDLASITKIAATTAAVMKLHETGKFDIDLPLSHYFPIFRTGQKSYQTTRDILAHQAYFQPWIPFFEKTMKNYQPDPIIYQRKPKPGFSTSVAKDLFIADNYKEVIFDTIAKSELWPNREYKYSDLGFYPLSETLSNILGKGIDEFAAQEFYRPLGATTLGYKPLERFDASRIVPTENDTMFRKQLIHGYVHDPGAAMLGGVSGHAGLFSNAGDLAKMMQMFLQNGFYGGKQYFKPSTVKEFTRQQFPLANNRRGIGFDKPYPEYDELGPVCESASLSSFGHSGFTGTYTWADPENGLLYVFLSNRIYPDAGNTKIVRMNLRTELHQLVYDILELKY
jgi:beta-N-acetylhexosaminidase